MSLEAFVKSLSPANYTSQFGEDGILRDIFGKIGVKHKYAVEVGINNGRFFSNTRRLVVKEGWFGLWIEKDKRLAQQALESARECRIFVIDEGVEVEGENSLTQMFDDNGTPKDFDLLSLDIDSYEWYIWNSLLTYHPRVVICEFDPNADPDFIPEIDGPGQAGMRAIHHVALARGYQVVCATQCNLICVRNDLMGLLTEEQPRCAHGLIIREREPAAFAGHSTMCKCCDNQFGYGGPCGDYCRHCEPKAESVHLDPAKPETAAEANGHKPAEELITIAVCASTPRIGFFANTDCLFQTLAAFNLPYFRGEGVYWEATLTRSIQRAIAGVNPKYILTFDYDTVWCPNQGNSDLAKLVCLLEDFPELDVAVPLQQKREGGELLASSNGEVDLNQRYIPITRGHFGLTLFRASVFDRLTKPWMLSSPNEAGEWEENRTDADIRFWMNCEENGIKVGLATDVIVGHLELMVTWPSPTLQPIYQHLNAWGESGRIPPPTAFTRESAIQAVLEMK